MIPLPPDFKEFLRLLNAKSVEYLLVGGHAVGYYGYPRATLDMDIWISCAPPNISRVLSVLREFGFDAPELSEDLFRKEGRIVRMGVPPFRIELLTSASGVEFEACYAERVNVTVDGAPVNLISLAHLRANKKASGRYKDLADLENLPLDEG
jgi:hypothetical protein